MKSNIFELILVSLTLLVLLSGQISGSIGVIDDNQSSTDTDKEPVVSAQSSITPNIVQDGVSVDVMKTYDTSNQLAVDWSPEGTSIAFGGSGNKLYVTDTTLSSLWNSSDLGDQISDVHFSPDGTIIAALTYNTGTFFFDATTGDLEKYSTYSGYSLSWSPDGNMIVIQNEIVSYSNVNSTEVSLTGHSYIELEVAWHPFKSLIATAAGDSTVKIWDTDTGDALVTINNNYHWVDELAWSPNGFGLIVGVRNGDLVYWDTVTEETVNWFNYTDGVTDVAWDPTGLVLAVGQDNQINVGLGDTYSLDDWKKSPTFSNVLTDFAWAPTNNKLVSVHRAGEVRIWDVDETKVTQIESTSGLSTIYTHSTFVRDIQQIGNSLYFSEASGSGGDGEIFEYNTITSTLTSYLNVSLGDVGGYWTGGFHIYESGVHDIVHIAQGSVQGADIYRVKVFSSGGIDSWSKIETVGDAFDVVSIGCGTLLYTDSDHTVYQYGEEIDAPLWEFEIFQPTSITYNQEYGDVFLGDYSARSGDVGIARIRNGGVMTYNPGYTGMATDDFYSGMYLVDFVDSQDINFVSVSSSSVSTDTPDRRDSNVCDRTVTDTVTSTTTETDTVTTGGDETDDASSSLYFSPLFLLPLLFIPILRNKLSRKMN